MTAAPVRRPSVTLTVLGGSGAWPTATQACSGYVVECGGFVLLMDPGYATLPRLLEIIPVDAIDAVLVSHRHPDHCADLNPLLRARALRDVPAGPLPVYSLPGALDAILALDRPGMLDTAFDLHEFEAGTDLAIGPFAVATRALPHSTPNAGFRIAAGGRAIAYTGDAGPSQDLVELANDVDLLLAEASYVDRVPEDSAGTLCSAGDAGRQAEQAGARALMLTHLLPGTPVEEARTAARATYGGPVDVARGGLVVTLA